VGHARSRSHRSVSFATTEWCSLMATWARCTSLCLPLFAGRSCFGCGRCGAVPSCRSPSRAALYRSPRRSLLSSLCREAVGIATAQSLRSRTNELTRTCRHQSSLARCACSTCGPRLSKTVLYSLLALELVIRYIAAHHAAVLGRASRHRRTLRPRLPSRCRQDEEQLLANISDCSVAGTRMHAPGTQRAR
jgi:hypothetical protein